MKKLVVTLALLASIGQNSFGQTKLSNAKSDQYRPQYHFTAKAHWMNDPNGMVYLNGTYHLFFQYHPDSSTWGPMHWGHAASKDMVHWQEQPIALYPDSLGTIFSGSAVVDVNNTSGFGKNGQTPLVAIFTHHNVDLEKKRRANFSIKALPIASTKAKRGLNTPAIRCCPTPASPISETPRCGGTKPGKGGL
jgi:fructan beta-fructosidase